jgi:hypothetical protein
MIFYCQIKRICRQLLEKQASATYNLVKLAEKLEIVQLVPSPERI